jgi:hypothetical protein
MGKVDIPQIEPKGNRTTDEYVNYLANMLAIIQEEMTNFLEGRISSENMREIAGYNVSQTDLKHKSGIVGMSGADPATATAVRFWAGNADKTVAPFRVQQDGTMYATDGNFEGDINGSVITGSLIQTAPSGVYPRMEFSDVGEILRAYASATRYVSVSASESGEPAVVFTDGTTKALVTYLSGSNFLLGTVLGVPMSVSSGGALDISANGEIDLSGSALKVDGITGYTGSFSTGTQIVTVYKGMIVAVV